MARISGFSHPFLLGFEEIEGALERVTRSGDGYPPYNIERVVRPGDGDILRISLAVAGFAPEDLDVTVEENRLVISGKRAEEAGRNYLHRGIAARQFQKSFLLAEGLEVLGAQLRNGLLSVDLARPATVRMARKVHINGLAS
jgi:HSP20 family molecular chaperone IbpA